MKNLDKYLLQIQEGIIFSDKTISVDLHKFESGEKDKLLIVGFPGSGKSTLGGKLAKKYKCKYFELDDCFWKKGFEKCCYDKIKMSKIKTVVEGNGTILSYFINYKNLKPFILEQPIIFLGKSRLLSWIMVNKREFKREVELKKTKGELKNAKWFSMAQDWEDPGDPIEKWKRFYKYNPDVDAKLSKFGDFPTQLNRFKKDRISQKGSIVKIYKK